MVEDAKECYREMEDMREMMEKSVMVAMALKAAQAQGPVDPHLPTVRVSDAKTTAKGA